MKLPTDQNPPTLPTFWYANHSLSFGPYLESANNELQEMLASYTTLKASPCVKCKRLMDPSAQFPTVRTRLRTKTTDSQHVYQWQAFHKSCI